MTGGGVRTLGWSAAGLVGLGLGVILARSDDWAGEAVGLGALAAFGGVLVVEAGLLGVGLIAAGRRRRVGPSDARPADGVVEVLAVAGVVTSGSAEADTWRRFEAIDPGADDSTQSGRATNFARPSNPPLLGQVALISVFVGCDGHRWTGREVAAAHGSLRSVGRWVEREAIARGAAVNVGLADTYFEVEDDHDEPVAIDFVGQGDDVGPFEAHATTKGMAAASRAAARLGFADVADLVYRINPRVAADAHVWLVHLKRRGRSYAIPVGDGVIRGVGLAICYARESSFPEPLVGPGRVDPTTVAHELFHLFGATDKYGVPLASFAPGQVSRRDVMRLDEDRLDRLRVGKLTAGEVGWPSS